MDPIPLDPAKLDPLLLAGVAAYRRHPYRRELPDPPCLWSDGETRLLDYGVAGTTRSRRRPIPVLFVPSLINRAYVLDLLPERSLLRFLAVNGVRPLLLDWGWPGPAERDFTLDALLAARLEPALRSVGAPVVLAGYCMGGLLALPVALRQPGLVRALALLATPWDFGADGPGCLAAGLASLEPILAATGTLPVDVLQAMFSAVAPGAVSAKFRAFAGLDPRSPAARDFVALEDWLNDGVPLAAPIARAVLGDWYRDNRPGRGTWQLGGHAVRPDRIACPSFVAVPARDRIVPPASALPLAAAIPGAVLHRPDAGHVGMTAGPRAEATLWRDLLGWLRAL